MSRQLTEKPSGLRCLVVCNGEASGFSAYKQRALTIAGKLEELDCSVTVLWYSRLLNPFGSMPVLWGRRITVPVPPFYAPLTLIRKASRFMSRLLARLVIRANRIDLVVAENPTMAAVCAGLKVPMICDFHGDVVEERKMNEDSAWEIRLAREEEETGCRQAMGWMCASESLRQALSARHGIAAPTAILPCSVDISEYAAFKQRREEARNRLGLGDRWVLCYAGGLASWQEIPQTLKLAAAMRAKEPRLFFLLITRDNCDAFKPQLAAIGREGEDYARLSLTHQEVLEMLPAADLGMLLRAPSPVNEVSSPTKCGEYLASGVPVLTTPYAGDASQVIARTKAGLVLSNYMDTEKSAELAVSYLRASMEDRASLATRSHRAAVEHYNNAHDMEKIGRLLNEVLPASFSDSLRQPEATITR